MKDPCKPVKATVGVTLLLVAPVLLSDLPLDGLPEWERWELVVLLKDEATDEESGGEIPSRDIAENLRFPIPVDDVRLGLGACTAGYVLPALLTLVIEGVVEGEGVEEGVIGGAVGGVIEGVVESAEGPVRLRGQEPPPLAVLPVGMMASILS